MNTLFYNHLLAEGVAEGHIVKFAFDSADDLRMIGEDLRNIVKRYKLHSDEDIGELLDILASGLSTLVNPKKLSATFKSVKNPGICATTVAKYISHLEDAFLISKVRRFDVKGKRYIDTPYKVYFEDIGLRNARLSFRQIEPTHLMENIIFNELRYRGYNVDVGVVESRERDKDGKEIRNSWKSTLLLIRAADGIIFSLLMRFPATASGNRKPVPLTKPTIPLRRSLLSNAV